MPRYLTLSRAARLVGVRRGALQAKIRSGELAAFEGMVSVDNLLRAYPQAHLEDNAFLERLEAIKDAAFARRVRERVLPSAEVLMARIEELERYCAILEDRLRTSRERLLRLMSAHVQVKPSGREFFVDGNDSLLEAALRAGLSLDYGCSSGSCGKCKARVVSGQVHRLRHSDYVLTAAEKAAGTVLMCCHTAATDLVIEAREAHGAADMPLQSIDARVKAVSPMGEAMRLLHLQTPRSNRLRFLAGQSVKLSLDEATASFPVASCPCDERNLHFHVPRRDGDAFAARVFSALKDGDTVRVEGPRGGFVLDEASTRPLVFVAFGTGFAPVKSLIEHAMALDASESLHLYWIAGGEGGHYLDNLCRAWNDALDNFHYVPLKSEPALGALLKDHPRLPECDVYVAGPAQAVHAAEFALLEHGVPRAQVRVSTLEV
jgi:CDP-4-dehydro-6-deoxyglucose reductase